MTKTKKVKTLNEYAKRAASFARFLRPWIISKWSDLPEVGVRRRDLEVRRG